MMCRRFGIIGRCNNKQLTFCGREGIIKIYFI